MQDKNKETRENLAAFAHRLSILAGRKRLRQVTIARMLSVPGHVVSPQRVGGWFQGRNFPGGDVERALAEILGTTRDWLIEGIENKETTAADATYPESPCDESGVRDDETSFCDSLERDLRKQFEALLAKARGDARRLGWVSEQFRAHLVPPQHWSQGKTRLVSLPDLPGIKSIRERANELREKAAQLPSGSERRQIELAAKLLDEGEDELERKRAAAQASDQKHRPQAS
jgi:transcriptional regulator with XRE-family HTH domain